MQRTEPWSISKVRVQKYRRIQEERLLKEKPLNRITKRKGSHRDKKKKKSVSRRETDPL